MLDGELEPSRLMELQLKSLPLETDEQNVERSSASCVSVLAIHVGLGARTLARALNACSARLNRARTQGPKGAYFATLRIVALTPRTVSG